MRNKSKLPQWHSTKSVIDWFKSLENKPKYRFIKFDIVDFYPSITQELLSNAICFAKKFTPIDDSVINTIMHCRKSLLFSDGSTWIKNNSTTFDVTMGSYDGAEVCKLVGLYLLSQLTVLTGNEFIGLYRDDGFAISPCTSGHLADQLRKKIVAIFKNNKLDITTECNLVQTDFLDLNLDLQSAKYWPYRKPNSEPLYIDARSNHPPSIKKHLPTMIANRISTNS